ncbi:endonuclease/exonuclease/phosphatase family protein [Pseudoalteromonas sp. SSDWG2]|uniref:endonuclease/exonuclease/phosphatase family protein n=1 Tax=Pseudoalteromonas sp. SSDWG2 TaxID=3139391 RepID=UPI003BA95179
MNSKLSCALLLGLLLLTSCAADDVHIEQAETQIATPTVRVATFNVSMDGSNYVKDFTKLSESPLPELLAEGTNEQIHNIAQIIQTVRPDIILLNEFDYTQDWQRNVELFKANFLSKAHGSAKAIDYPYAYSAPSNTGISSKFDFDGNGKKTGNAGDAYGFGFYPGQYAMVLLSRYPIDADSVRTFQHLKWHTQENAVMPMLEGQPFYDQQTWHAAKLSSKSFWDIPVRIGEHTLHVLASHPTPPVFDGPEDRNGLRNIAEIKLVADYITENSPSYLIDDKGVQGGLAPQSRFVVVGDLNAAPEGEKARPEAINHLLEHPLVNATVPPASAGGAASEDAQYAKYYTASWRARADYVLPSKAGLEIVDAGVFWPHIQDEGYELVKDRTLSSDHRLVWMDLKLIAHGGN